MAHTSPSTIADGHRVPGEERSSPDRADRHGFQARQGRIDLEGRIALGFASSSPWTGSRSRGRGTAVPMDPTEQQGRVMEAVSVAMVKLHKEQFGRGPTQARSHYAGPNALVCVLEGALLPAERKLVALGDADQVRATRTSFQVATEAEFIEAVEHIVDRKVRSFASAIDPLADVVFENFAFEPVKAAADRPPAPAALQ